MNKTNLKTTLLCVLALLGLLGLNWILFHFYVQIRLDMRTAWLASHDIPPRTLISEQDLYEVKVPGAYLLDHACAEKSEIIGKITEIQGMIPAGSVFYRSMLHDPSALQDLSATQLRQGQTLYAVCPDAVALSSLTGGMRTDIYFTAERKNEPAVTGCLIQHARIIAVKDHKGLLLSDPNSTGIAYMAELAVSTDDIGLLTFAETLGELRLFTAAEPYASDQEAEAAVDSNAYQWLVQMQQEVPEI